MAQKVFLAVDLGASGGRHVAGLFDGKRLELAEVYRFENGPIAAAGNLYWDLLRLWSEMTSGLRAAGQKYTGQIASVGVDAWGVDFGLLGRNDELLGNPYNYRDSRTNGMLEKTFEIINREEIFEITGCQFMEINTLYQLMAMRVQNSPLLEAAETLLMMPDLFHWLLTGEKANEFSDATTTQFFNPTTKSWATGMLDKLGIPTSMLGQIVQPGTKLGPLLPEVARATGLSNVEVVLPGTHDTASAVMSVPAASKPGARPDWCYISSGTWSLMGVETPEPVISEKCSRLNFTNEGGVGGTIRLLKNITGLWIVQECRRVWKLGGQDYSWDQLVEMSAQAEPLVSFVDPDHADLTAPTDMPEAIRRLCSATGQSVPESPGAVIRCGLEGLALKYRQVLGWIEELIEGRIETIHIVGGGTQNRQLCQMTADACNRRVVAGPIEATAIGNVMMQAIAAGDVGSIAEARQIIRESFDVVEYQPQNAEAWDAAFEKFQAMTR